MANETTTTALATVEQHSGDMQVSAQMAMARHEIEGALIIAQRMPRNEDVAFGKIAKACGRFAFAGMALYSYPRGGTQIEGPSVNLARLMAACWGNMRSGFDIIHDDDKSRTVRGWAWDLETNTKEQQDATFKKLVQRKVRKGKQSSTQWVEPDERDLRELTNKHGGIAARNCTLHLLPPDFIEDAKQICKETVNAGISEDVDDHRRKIIRAFGGLGVRPDDLESHLGHPLAQATPDEIATLRTIYKSISDGNSIWSEYVADKQPETPPVSDSLTPKKAAATSTPEKETPGELDPSEVAQLTAEYGEAMDQAIEVNPVNELKAEAMGNPRLTPEALKSVVAYAEKRCSAIRGARGSNSNT